MRQVVKIVAIIILVTSPILIAFAIVFFQEQTSEPTQQPATKPASEAAEITISCPVAKGLCRQGKIIDNGDNFYGYAFNLPSDTLLLTVFPGQLSDQPKAANRPATQPLLYLKDNQGLEAAYSYFGSASNIQTREYQKGEPIGKIGKGQFPSVVPFAGSNLLISVKKDNKFIRFILK